MMKRMSMILAGELILSCSAYGAEIAPDTTLIYKKTGETELRLHVFNPEDHEATDQRPAIVFFHGGGWTHGEPSMFYAHCEYLASRGLVAMSAEYRIRNKHQTTPRECVMDGKSAIRWVRQHAGELGVNPEQIIAGGGSAGGHVAAATGTTKGFEEEGEELAVSSCPVALVLFNPVYDNGPGGFAHAKVKAYWKDFSPMHNLSEETPPTIVFLGTKDKFLPVETAREYKRLMEEKGRRCDLHLYEGQPHGFYRPERSKENFTTTVTKMDRFLASLGYLEGDPTVQN